REGHCEVGGRGQGARPPDFGPAARWGGSFHLSAPPLRRSRVRRSRTSGPVTPSSSPALACGSCKAAPGASPAPPRLVGQAAGWPVSLGLRRGKLAEPCRRTSTSTALPLRPTNGGDF